MEDAGRLSRSLERVDDAGCNPRDQALVTAAASVYELSAAKAAMGSSQGRRILRFGGWLKSTCSRVAHVPMRSRSSVAIPTTFLRQSSFGQAMGRSSMRPLQEQGGQWLHEDPAR